METQVSSLPYALLCRRFSLDEILSATQNFDDALVVGKGGFGKVYKADINVENGATFTVAIKRLDSSSNQGAPEFWAEIETLTKLRHCNLVSLIGYCNDNPEMILIYEFMPLGTLDGRLHEYGASLTWIQRLKISIGATRGLHYLHSGTGTQQGVIHRDVKSSNILLDKDYAAKISDFGLSKIGPTDVSGAYVNTLIKGSFGYLDPEYFWTGRLTMKSDVFAFGVVLFELLCGRAAVDKRLDDDKCSLVKWAHESIEKGKVYEIIDLNIKSQIAPKCLKVYVQIADRCLSSESKKRPTMTDILVALELSLTLQNKFDRRVKPAAGISAFARMIKWPFNHASSSTEQSDDHFDIFSTDDLKQDDHFDIFSTDDLKQFSFDDLKTATGDFADSMRLGGGEFGEVFKGWMDTNTSSLSTVDGSLRIAIRRFYHSKIQHHLSKKQIDLTFLSEFNHPNVVTLLGYCFKHERLFLIYEFMENGSLDSHLFTKDKRPLSWKTRVHIALGVGEAFLFLQRPRAHMVHKLSIRIHQILLDKNFNAKISDVDTGILVRGLSNGDPLYYHPSYYTQKWNNEFEGIIRSFGLVLVQILTGESNIANLKQIMSNQNPEEDRRKSLRDALDPRLPDKDDTTILEAVKLGLLAFTCLDGSCTLVSALTQLRQLKTV